MGSGSHRPSRAAAVRTVTPPQAAMRARERETPTQQCRDCQQHAAASPTHSRPPCTSLDTCCAALCMDGTVTKRMTTMVSTTRTTLSASSNWHPGNILRLPRTTGNCTHGNGNGGGQRAPLLTPSDRAAAAAALPPSHDALRAATIDDQRNTPPAARTERPRVSRYDQSVCCACTAL